MKERIVLHNPQEFSEEKADTATTRNIDNGVGLSSTSSCWTWFSIQSGGRRICGSGYPIRFGM